MKSIIFLLLIASTMAFGSASVDFSLPDLSGNSVTLSGLLERGPVVLDFWATWCGPCVKELPFIQKLHEEFADSGIIIVGVSEDTPKTVSRVKPFVKSRKLTFPILLDKNQDLMRTFKIASIPYICIIDQSGEMVYSHMGYKPGDEKELRQRILEILQSRTTGEDE